jgi:hypothetical protein
MRFVEWARQRRGKGLSPTPPEARTALGGALLAPPDHGRDRPQDLAEVERYTRAVDQERWRGSGIARIGRRRNDTD